MRASDVRADVAKPCLCQIVPADCGGRVGAGRGLLAIAGAGRNSMGRELFSRQGDGGEQAEQARRGTCNSLVRPVALGFDVQVIAHVAERDLHLRALHEPVRNLGGVMSRIGAQQGLRAEPAGRVAHQHPADRDDGHPAVAPDSGGGADLDAALATGGSADGLPGAMVGGRPFVPGSRGGAGSQGEHPGAGRLRRRRRAGEVLPEAPPWCSVGTTSG